MKKIVQIILALLPVTMTWQAMAQHADIDTTAVAILDRMSATMYELKSCSVAVSSEYDVSSQSLGLVKHTDEERVYLSGNNKLFVNTEGDKGSRDLIYNGKTFTYYSNTKNHYAQEELNTTTVGMIDSMNKAYGIIFPAADYLYPSFVDDILAASQKIEFLGMTRVEGKDCFHIAGVCKDKTYQFWISGEPYFLPAKMVVVYTDKPLNPQFEAVYHDWQINPTIPDGVFEFQAPPGAAKIKFMTAEERKMTTEKKNNKKK